MAQLLGVQEVKCEEWFDAAQCEAAYKTEGGWCAFWLKRPHGLPVERGSVVTIQIACEAPPEGHTGAGSPTVLEVEFDMKDKAHDSE